MKPLSAERAKPSLCILDVPLLLGMARMLAEQGIEGLIVNTHPHPETVRAALRDSPIPVSFSHEPDLRGSGGGILGARELLPAAEPLLVLNGDMALELDLPELLHTHRKLGALATVVVRDDQRKERFGTLGFDRSGRLTRITELVSVGTEDGSGLFTGVHVLEPSIYDQMPAMHTFGILTDVYVPALRSGRTLGAFLHSSDARWSPIGTPADLLEANLESLRAESLAPENGCRVAPDAEVRGELVSPVWVGSRAEIESGALVGPSVVIGTGARIAARSRLERVLVLEGTVVPPGSIVRNAVLGSHGVTPCE